MKVMDQLAASLGRRDEVPNVELAARIAKRKDADAVSQLVELVAQKNKTLEADAIKTLYEIGAIDPALIGAYVPQFVACLKHKNNRMVWGAMYALAACAKSNPAKVIPFLHTILETVDKGSVITRDQGVMILMELASHKKNKADMIALLLDILKSAPYNQFPSYAEKILTVVDEISRPALLRVLKARFSEFTDAPKIKRLEKLIHSLSK